MSSGQVNHSVMESLFNFLKQYAKA